MHRDNMDRYRWQDDDYPILIFPIVEFILIIRIQLWFPRLLDSYLSAGSIRRGMKNHATGMDDEIRGTMAM